MTSSITCDLARAAGLAGLLLASSAALAQPAQGDPVAAQALFKAARDLVDAGDYAAGCPKFEASLALSPSASTLINIARCHEHFGKLASAWDAYSRALALNVDTKGADRRKGLEDLAKKGIAAIEPRLPKLRVVVKSVEGLKVMRDGVEIPSAALNDALPADPGKHEIQATAPGHRTETRSVTLEEGKTATVELTLVASPPQAGAGAPPEKPKGGVPVWAWISGAGGLALSGAAVYFLVDNLAAIDALQSPKNCVPLDGGGHACNPRYDYAADNARKNLDLPLFIGLGSAGVLALGAAVGGIVHGVSSSKKQEPAASPTAAVWLAPGGGGAIVTGEF